jgi:hypothetical protein
MRNPDQIGALVKAAFAGTSGEFRPCAFFDDRLDCIRVVAKDCSILETRINPSLTVLEDNYFGESKDGKQYVGFAIKGARYFCSEHGFDLNTPIEVSALLDAVLKAFPDMAVELFVNGIARPLVSEGKIERVDVSGISGSTLHPARA